MLGPTLSRIFAHRADPGDPRNGAPNRPDPRSNRSAVATPAARRFVAPATSHSRFSSRSVPLAVPRRLAVATPEVDAPDDDSVPRAAAWQLIISGIGFGMIALNLAQMDRALTEGAIESIIRGWKN